MLRCPKCSRTYEPDSQKFCTHDGGRLVPDTETPSNFDPNATVHGNFAQFKEMGSLSKPEAGPSPPPDLGKTVMSQPLVADPSGPTVKDLVSSSQDLLRESDQNPTSMSLPQLPDELDEVETQWSMAPPALSEPVVPPPIQPDPVPALPDQPQSFDNEQSFATQLSAPPVEPAKPAESGPPPITLASAPPAAAPSNPVPPMATPLGGSSAGSGGTVPPAPPKKKRRVGLIIAGVAVVLLGFVAVAGVGAFLYWNNLQKHRGGNRNHGQVDPHANVNGNDTGNRNSGTNANVTKPGNANTSSAPADAETFTNSRANLQGPLADHYIDFSFYYPKAWQVNPAANSVGNYVDLTLRTPDNLPVENIVVSYYESAGTVAVDRESFDRRIAEKSAKFAKSVANYEKVSAGDTTVNSIAGYEFRFKGQMNVKGSPAIWGRMVFLPPGKMGDTNGVTLVMYSTSLSPEVHGVDDVGVKGGLPVILNSFKFGH